MSWQADLITAPTTVVLVLVEGAYRWGTTVPPLFPNEGGRRHEAGELLVYIHTPVGSPGPAHGTPRFLPLDALLGTVCERAMDDARLRGFPEDESAVRDILEHDTQWTGLEFTPEQATA